MVMVPRGTIDGAQIIKPLCSLREFHPLGRRHAASAGDEGINHPVFMSGNAKKCDRWIGSMSDEHGGYFGIAARGSSAQGSLAPGVHVGPGSQENLSHFGLPVGRGLKK